MSDSHHDIFKPVSVFLLSQKPFLRLLIRSTTRLRRRKRRNIKIRSQVMKYYLLVKTFSQFFFRLLVRPFVSPAVVSLCSCAFVRPSIHLFVRCTCVRSSARACVRSAFVNPFIGSSGVRACVRPYVRLSVRACVSSAFFNPFIRSSRVRSFVHLTYVRACVCAFGFRPLVRTIDVKTGKRFVKLNLQGSNNNFTSKVILMTVCQL